MIFTTLVEKFKHFSYRLKSNKTKFTQIYARKGFTGEAHPLSGIGSSIKSTRKIREQLPVLLHKYGIHRIVDVPCGDFTWMSKIDLGEFEYFGFDIVTEIIQQNQKKYAADNIHFDEMDIIKQIPPDADLIICRDCFIHLSNRDTVKALLNFKKSGSKYLLATTFLNLRNNDDLVSGRGWRPINMERPPFNLAKPVTIILEDCTENEVACTDKALGLWLIRNLP